MQENIRPFLFLPLWSLLSVGNFKTGCIPMSQIISLDTTVSTRRPDGGNCFLGEEDENYTGRK